MTLSALSLSVHSSPGCLDSYSWCCMLTRNAMLLAQRHTYPSNPCPAASKVVLRGSHMLTQQAPNSGPKTNICPALCSVPSKAARLAPACLRNKPRYGARANISPRLLPEWEQTNQPCVADAYANPFLWCKREHILLPSGQLRANPPVLSCRC